MGASWSVLGGSWEALGASCGRLGTLLRSLGSLLGAFGSLLERLGFLFPESGCEGFYFSGLGGLGVGTERQIRGNPRRNRHNGIRWGRWPDSLISGVVGEALEEGSWCLGEGGPWGPLGSSILASARFPTMDCGA